MKPDERFDGRRDDCLGVEGSSRVCITVSNSLNPPHVYRAFSHDVTNFVLKENMHTIARHNNKYSLVDTITCAFNEQTALFCERILPQQSTM